MQRRDVLKGIGTAAVALSTPASVFGASDELSVVIQQDGKSLTFSAATGVDLGDFVGPQFTQRCIRVDRPDTPLSVFFRPDRGSDRLEVVVELGRMWGKPNENAQHMGAYRAIIRRGERTVATVDVPRHWWFARWRWQSAPRPIVRKPVELIKSGQLLPYAEEAAAFAKPAHQSDPTIYERPMDTGGLQTGVGAAGERNDIGPVTEYQADYIVSGRSEALTVLRAQAEAAASMPMHVRDERTGAPVDFFQYPDLDWYQTKAGEPWVKGSEAIRSPEGKLLCEWNLDSAHDPALNYLPFLLTGDPYHLEELQFQCNRNLGWTGYHRSENKLQLVYPGETRSFAWSIRTLFQVAACTPASTPKWLKPRAYWKRMLDDNFKWYTKHYVDNPAPPCSIFSAGPRVDSIAAWIEEFTACSLGWGVLLGFEDWRRVFNWKVKSTLARTNGKSGWPRQWCVPYYFPIAKGEPQSMYTERSPADIWFKSWKESWEAFRADPENKVTEPFPDKTSWAQHNSPDYLVYTRGVLALATHLDVKDALEPLNFVDNMVKGEGYMHYKWSIAPKR